MLNIFKKLSKIIYLLLYNIRKYIVICINYMLLCYNFVILFKILYNSFAVLYLELYL
jgi:hypothetical protein